MHFRFYVFSVFILLASCKPQPTRQNSDFLAENLDTSVSPRTDFFAYANGGWIKKNPIPSDQNAWGIGYLVQLDIYNRLYAINQKAMQTPAAKGTITQQIGDYWFSGMDSAAIEKAALQPVSGDLLQIDRIETIPEFLKLTAAFGSKGVDALFSPGVYQDEKNSEQMALHVWQGGLGMPDRDYYFNTDEKTNRVREAYRNYVYRSFRLLGQDSIVARKNARDVYDLEARLAKNSRKIEQLRDPGSNYHKMALPDMQQRFKIISWDSFLTQADFQRLPDSIIIGQPEFLAAVCTELTKTPVAIWKQYLSLHYLQSVARYLNDDVFMNWFNYRRQLSGAEKPKARWKRVLDAESIAMGEALGHLFVEEYFPEHSKQRYITMVESMRTAYAERIRKLTWMSDSTKQKALLKLAKISKKIGYPDKWKDYHSLIIDRGPWVLNVQRSNAWSNHQQIDKLFKPVDRTEWDMPPQEYNAYYNSSNNEIVFPAASFMVPGKKDEDLDDAFVYGYVAASTIGHEMTHGFDDEGRKFDENGNLHDWWLPADAKKYQETAQKIVRQFNAFVPVDSLHVNGLLTAGENIADLGGLEIGWDAFSKTEAFHRNEKIGGLTAAQRFFLGYAHSWLYSERKERIASQLMTDEHAPSRERVNGPMSNLDAFYAAFGVKPGDKMYVPDSLKVRIW